MVLLLKEIGLIHDLRIRSLKFINLPQLLVFSNNSEYDQESIITIQSTFYASPDLEDVRFNCFREEELDINNKVKPLNEDIEKEI